MTKKLLYDPETGIHRAKIWEIMLFAFNNTSTNMTFVLFGAIAYYLNGFVGVTVAAAGYIGTVMRLWDAVTDPFVGYIVDKTNGRFGKNRPFIIIGNLIQAGGSALIFFAIPLLPEESVLLKFVAYIVFYMIYLIGYTFQTVVTKSAQSCLTNDPKQRPIFASFDTIFGAVIFSIIPLYTINHLGKLHATAFDEAGKAITTSAYTNPEYFQALWFFVAGVSFITAILAVIGIWRKDRNEYFGTGKAIKIGFKDYWDTIKNNRAIQMLILAASSDKLTGSVQTNSTVLVMLFGIIVGDFNQYANGNAIIGIPQAAICAVVLLYLASKLGQRKALVIGSIGGVITAGLMVLLFVFGDATTLTFDFASRGFTLFTVLYILIFVLLNIFKAMCAGMVITMNADCADYEVYRSGKYVPGLMGTLFSFVDKVVSSLATTIVALCVSFIGYKHVLPQQNDPLTTQVFVLTMILFMGFPALGWILNLVAMKFYPLTKEKMEEIQEKIGEIKRNSQNN